MPCTPGVPLIISRIRIVIPVPIAKRNPDHNSYNMVKREVDSQVVCVSHNDLSESFKHPADQASHDAYKYVVMPKI